MIVLKVGVQAWAASSCRTSRRRAGARRRAADLPGDGAARSRAAVRRRPPRHDPRGAGHRPRELRRRERVDLRGDRRARGAALRRRDCNFAVQVPELGLVGDPLPCAPPAIVGALAAGLVPVVTPSARGPLNVNADEMASALST